MSKIDHIVERFNSWVSRGVLGITLYRRRHLETLLSGFNVADNGRCRRNPEGPPTGLAARVAYAKT
ncbi:hypothetical protein [Methylobacterium brachiatum]|uniref:hypothetical protein n=1 Tax=Methylobacterium brachiatum TaxID=269660 RepID=UPI001113FF46|nr:hypothetical protein [Methylobacterium brachiatum]